MLELGDLHHRWHERVLAVACRILHDRDDADEVAQEVFIAAWRRLPDYDAARGSEWVWLRTITVSRCLDRLRAVRRQRRLSLEAQREPPREDEPPEEPGNVAALVLRLPEPQRTVVRLAFVEGCTHREIASRMALPLGTVKSRIRVGLKRLAALLPAPTVALRLVHAEARRQH